MAEIPPDVDVWRKPTHYCKAIILQLKKIINCIYFTFFVIGIWRDYSEGRYDKLIKLPETKQSRLSLIMELIFA